MLVNLDSSKDCRRADEIHSSLFRKKHLALQLTTLGWRYWALTTAGSQIAQALCHHESVPGLFGLIPDQMQCDFRCRPK